MKIWICGIAGVLGSALAEFFVNKGFEVFGNDIIRIEEAWRLENVRDKIRYVWKSTLDISKDDVKNMDIIIDASLAVTDRPLGISSPFHTVIGNILPALKLLEVVKKLDKKPILIYPSSFNALYGRVGEVYTEDTPIAPASVYGWTKAAAEELYRTYYRAYKIPVVITRVGSSFGERGRSDELPHRLIIHCLKNKPFILKSPFAKRLWTYMGDVLEFYDKLIEKIHDVIGMTLICAGNKGDKIVTNLELAELIKKLTNSNIEIKLSDYEPGELINGKPIDFKIDASKTRKLLGWEPKHALEEGLIKTINWFKENIHRYVVVIEF